MSYLLTCLRSVTSKQVTNSQHTLCKVKYRIVTLIVFFTRKDWKYFCIHVENFMLNNIIRKREILFKFSVFTNIRNSIQTTSWMRLTLTMECITFLHKWVTFPQLWLHCRKTEFYDQFPWPCWWRVKTNKKQKYYYVR